MSNMSGAVATQIIDDLIAGEEDITNFSRFVKY
jgi:hypothetical protein